MLFPLIVLPMWMITLFSQRHSLGPFVLNQETSRSEAEPHLAFPVHRPFVSVRHVFGDDHARP